MLDDIFDFLNTYAFAIFIILLIIIVVAGYLALFVWGTPIALAVVDHRWETYQVDQVYESYTWYTQSCTSYTDSKGNKYEVCTSIPHYGERWRSFQTRYAGGVYGDDHIVYPEVIQQGEGNVLGNIRPAESGLNYLVVFVVEGGGNATMTVSEADFLKYPSSSRWKAIKTILGNFRWDTLERTL